MNIGVLCPQTSCVVYPAWACILQLLLSDTMADHILFSQLTQAIVHPQPFDFILWFHPHTCTSVMSHLHHIQTMAFVHYCSKAQHISSRLFQVLLLSHSTHKHVMQSTQQEDWDRQGHIYRYLLLSPLPVTCLVDTAHDVSNQCSTLFSV